VPRTYGATNLNVLLTAQANIGDMLLIDVAYITSLLDPVAPWGEQAPHK
jgi:hypothetical protein